jgi:hypothetical protein
MNDMQSSETGRLPEPTSEAIERLKSKLRLTTPLIAVYDSHPSDAFEPLIEPKGTTCCFAYYGRWLAGETLVLERGGAGCQGAYRALGLEKTYPSYMAHFLTDGVGAPKGEGLRASPGIAQAYIDRATPPEVGSDTILIGPLRLGQWPSVRSVTFLVDPDRLGGVMTLAGYWSAENVVAAPFGSGCSFLWRALDESGQDQAVIGATDIAMRRYLPPDLLTFTVSPARFQRMLAFPDQAFLNRSWWNDLLDYRQRARER